MSVRCEMFLGWTVKLIEGDVSNNDFEFFEQLEEREPDFQAFKGKYSVYTDDDTKVKLVVDGMNGLYVRLIYVHKNKSIIVLVMKLIMKNYLTSKFQMIFIMS